MPTEGETIETEITPPKAGKLADSCAQTIRTLARAKNFKWRYAIGIGTKKRRMLIDRADFERFLKSQEKVLYHN